MLTRKAKAAAPDSHDALTTLRDRLAFLRARMDTLHETVHRATETEARFLADLDAAKADLAQGRIGPEGVADVTAALAGHRTILAATREALDAVKVDADDVERKIHAEESMRESARQYAAAQPDLDRAAALEAEFVRRILALAEPLRERVEILNRIEAQYPLVARPGAIPLDRLSEAVVRGWRGPHATEIRHGVGSKYWIVGCIEGPVRTASGRDDILRTLGLSI